MLTDAANIIFQSAKRRCYVITSVSKKVQVVDLTEDDEAWAALDEVQGGLMEKGGGRNKTEVRPKWLPEGLEPVLEELPKWHLLSEILLEAEGEIIRQENLKKTGSTRKFHVSLSSPLVFYTTSRVSAGGSSNTILVMTSSTRTCNLVTEFLSSMDGDALPGTRGRTMMMRKLRSYLWWKGQLGSKKKDGRQPPTNVPARSISGNRGHDLVTSGGGEEEEISAALKKKDQDRAQKAQSRRRVRGGAPLPAVSGSSVRAEQTVVPKPEPREYTLRGIQGEADGFVQL